LAYETQKKGDENMNNEEVRMELEKLRLYLEVLRELHGLKEIGELKYRDELKRICSAIKGL